MAIAIKKTRPQSLLSRLKGAAPNGEPVTVRIVLQVYNPKDRSYQSLGPNSALRAEVDQKLVSDIMPEIEKALGKMGKK